MTVILLTCKKLQSTKITSFPVMHLTVCSLVELLGLISKVLPLHLGNPFPLNNITYFTKKENSQDVGLQNNVVSRFSKVGMPLGI